MIQQRAFQLRPFPRGFHVITELVLQALGELPAAGLLHLFIQHTSAGICINENADDTVLADFEYVYNRLVPEQDANYRHQVEGPDDMPAHIKSVFTGHSVQIPIADGRLQLGVWQGIYLAEFRDRAPGRKFFATILS